jgi:DNA-directed RNA polymerase specialized sigma24 family protein
MSAVTASDPDFVPSDMDELARHYYDFIRGMVRKCGIPDQDAGDSVQYILERLGKTGAIAQYDPDHLTEHQGRLVKTRFSTFLGAKVMIYCRGERGRVGKRAWHEVQILDRPADGEEGTGLSMLLGSLGSACDDYSALESGEFIREMRAALAAIPPRSARDTCDLAALFDELVHEISETGAFSYAAIQARFGISGTTAGAWLSRLRTVLSRILDRPLAVIGGVALTAEQVTAALKILREAKGIMVRQPLARAGHPLSQAEKGWYHGFAREEMKKFPALAAGPGTHRKPAGHVKEAVIHRLERILAEAGAPVAGAQAPAPAPSLAAPEPATPEDEFEARLWRYIRDAAEMDEIKALARRAYAAVSALWASAFTGSSAMG